MMYAIPCYNETVNIKILNLASLKWEKTKVSNFNHWWENQWLISHNMNNLLSMCAQYWLLIFSSTTEISHCTLESKLLILEDTDPKILQLARYIVNPAERWLSFPCWCHLFCYRSICILLPYATLVACHQPWPCLWLEVVMSWCQSLIQNQLLVP